MEDVRPTPSPSAAELSAATTTTAPTTTQPDASRAASTTNSAGSVVMAGGADADADADADEEEELMASTTPTATASDEERVLLDADVSASGSGRDSAVPSRSEDNTPVPTGSGAATTTNGAAEGTASAAAAAVRRAEAAAIQETKRAQRDALKKLRDEQNAKVASSKSASAEARLRFLQQQVEVFAHFTGTGSSAPGAATTTTTSSSSKKGGRTRMTEEEEDRELIEEGKKASRLTRLTVQPGCVTGTMRAYQIEGLNWLINLYEQGINGILADEMGLGKTLQSISLLAYLKFERNVSGPHLIIVPKAVLSNWLREIARWAPGLKVIHVHGDKDERAEQIRTGMRAGTFDVCVTTFEVLSIERAAFRKFQWRYLMVDEAHRLKNEQSVTAKLMRELDTQFRLLITGTPLQNNLHELWALLNFLLPEVFGDASLFEDYFKLEDIGEESVITKLHAILRPFMIRRLKADVEKSLPPKREIKLHTGLSEMQQYWYKLILNRDITALNQLGGPDRSRLLNILMQLRKVCNHPYLFQGAEPGPPFIDGPHIWENSGKMLLLDKLLGKLKKNGDRVLIFSQMTRMLDILEDYVRLKDYDYCRIDGSSKADERDAAMDAFNAPGSSKFCFLLSTRAGGLGINLATANIVILYDSDWNPQMDLQAQDRAHRIGQTKEVTVFRLVTESTVEEKIVERAEKKLYLDAAVVQQGRLQQANQALSKNELMTMVKFGAEAIFRTGGAKITDEDIDIILERDAKRTEEMREKFKTNVQHNLLNFRLDAGADTSSLLLDADPAASTGHTFIELAPRTAGRGRDRATDAAAAEAEEREAKPRGLQMNDVQFFDQEKIRAIEEKEHEWASRRRVQSQLIRDAKIRERRERADARRRERAAAAAAAGQAAPTETAGADDDDKDAGEEDATAAASLESTRLTAELETMQISDEMKAEKDRLIAEGFPTWNRKDFRAYTSAVEKFGRKNVDDVCQAVMEQTNKSRAEVARYHAVFWQRYKEVDGWEKIIDRVEKGEQKIQRREQITALLVRKIARTPNPWQQLQIEYSGGNRGKAFTEEEDRFLVCAMQRDGYGSWDVIRQEIRKNWAFRFDWFFRSRTSLEIQRRCDVLIRMIEKEEEDLQALQSGAAGAVVSGGGGGGKGGDGEAGDDKPGKGGAGAKKRKSPAASAAANAAAGTGDAAAAGAEEAAKKPAAKRTKKAATPASAEKA